MLYLIEQNKFGRNIVNDDQITSWRNLFKTSEDSLTSSVFSLLFYLPVELLWSIFRRSCYGNNLPQHCGKLISYEFWPKWDCTNTCNTNYIEPDIFIRFEAFNLIIETKRYDYIEQQSRSQIQDEIQAYHNEYGLTDSNPLYFIALAGILSGKETWEPILVDEKEITITSCRWQRILSEVKNSSSKILSTRHLLNSTDSIIYILEDLIKAFRIHGFSTGQLLCTMPKDYQINSNYFLLSSKQKFNFQALLNISNQSFQILSNEASKLR